MRELKKYIVGLGIWCYNEDECKNIYDTIKREGFAIDSMEIGKPIEGVTDKWIVHIRTTSEVKKEIKKKLKSCKLITEKERYF